MLAISVGRTQLNDVGTKQHRFLDANIKKITVFLFNFFFLSSAVTMLKLLNQL